MIGGSTVSPDDDPLGPVVESFLTRFRRGERPALTELIARHPELAGRIRELIPALVELEQLGRSTGDSIPSPGPRTDSRESGAEGPLPERLGDYVILRRIGGGGMGVVYEAERESLKSRVAAQRGSRMHPRFRADRDYLRRFHAEARLAATLHHTNIVGVFDYGPSRTVSATTPMQFIQGQPLDLVLGPIIRRLPRRRHARRWSPELRCDPHHPRRGPDARPIGRRQRTLDRTLRRGDRDRRAGGGDRWPSRGGLIRNPRRVRGPLQGTPGADRDVNVQIVVAGRLGRVAVLSRGSRQGRCPSGRRPGVRPPPGRAPSRHQAVQPPTRRDGQRLGDGLRPGQVRGGRGNFAVSRTGGHDALHGPGAVPTLIGPPRRHLLPGRDPLRAPSPCGRPSRIPDQNPPDGADSQRRA